MERDDVESFAPVAGSVMPSCRKTGYTKGADIDSIFRQMDREDVLKEVSQYPVGIRKAMFRTLMQQRRTRS